jgi:hypothetical protein
LGGGGGDGSFVGRGAWGIVDGTCRGFDCGLETMSATSVSVDKTSKNET